LGLAIIGSKLTNSPWYSASDFAQTSFIASTDSRIRLKRVASAELKSPTCKF